MKDLLFNKTAKMHPTALQRLARACRGLPSPDNPLHGIRRPPPPLPENIICFQRRLGADLNRPRQGRAMHHRHVLITPLRGRAVVCAGDNEHVLTPGRGLVVLPYQYHHYQDYDRRLHWLFVTFEYAPGVVLEPLRDAIFSVQEDLALQLEGVLQAHRDPLRHGPPELRLALILSRLTPTPEGPAAAARVDWEPLVDHAAQTRRPAAATIRELAHDIGMSPSNLRARFRASCGVSLGRHLREQRLERARGLLRMTTARIGEIADQCGYPSVYSFSRAFKQRHGVSPLAYRQHPPT